MLVLSMIPYVLCAFFIQYLAFSGTNLLMKCHSASSCFLLFLYFRKVVQKIFSELNGTNCQHLIIMRGRLCQKMTGWGSARWPDPTPARPALCPRRGGVWAHPGSPDSASSPIYSPIRENPRETRNIPRKFRSRRHLRTRLGRVLELFPAPCWRENHRRRPS